MPELKLCSFCENVEIFTHQEHCLDCINCLAPNQQYLDDPDYFKDQRITSEFVELLCKEMRKCQE